MKFIILLMLVLTACNRVPKSIVDKIPNGYNINDPVFAESKQRLLELVAECGEGVVDGVDAPNKCTYTIRMDSLFFTHMNLRTGFNHNTSWPYLHNEVFYTPKMDTVVPDKFDVKDLMTNIPPILKQECGDCVAWSTTHAIEIARAVHDKKVFDHSKQTVNSCEKV